MPLPSSLALTSITNGSSLTSSPVRNNFSAVQSGFNDLLTFLTGWDMPWLVDADVFQTAISHSGWDSNSVVTTAIYNALKETSDALTGHEINFDVILGAGTWTLELMHCTNANRGIYTVQIDAVTVGTIDGYSAGSVPNVRSSVAGVTVAATGKKRVKLLINTKNASSSGYWGSIQHLQCRRTA